MSDFVFSPPPQPAAPVAGGGLFPVRRIFCIGRNYAKHVREMGGDPKTSPPVFFSKPADALVTDNRPVPYPTITTDLEYEGELVIALGKGGASISVADAPSHIFGYAAGCDLTRRDLQFAAKKAGAPWDAAKGFDHSAPIGAIARAPDVDLAGAHLTTKINGEERQSAPLSDMIWSVAELVSHLSDYFELAAGDLIFTGTPEGVSPIVAGDRVEVQIGALPALDFKLT